MAILRLPYKWPHWAAFSPAAEKEIHANTIIAVVTTTPQVYSNGQSFLDQASRLELVVRAGSALLRVHDFSTVLAV